MESVMRFPMSYRITAFISAGVVEELLSAATPSHG
jgi:hypothetical protein